MPILFAFTKIMVYVYNVDMINITSKDNNRIREVLKIKREGPKESGLAVIEGIRICTDAFRSGVPIKTLFITEKMLGELPYEIIDTCDDVIRINEDLAVRISGTINPQGVFAVVSPPICTDFVAFDISICKRILICDAIRDPGNLGSIIRSADAFGFDAVIISIDCVDPYSDKVLRSTMGSIFHIKIVRASNLDNTYVAIKNAGFTIYTTSLSGENIDDTFIFNMPCAIILGNEAKGVGFQSLDAADKLIKIAMTGNAESLNVASAAAVLCFLAQNSKP